MDLVRLAARKSLRRPSIAFYGTSTASNTSETLYQRKKSGRRRTHGDISISQTDLAVHRQICDSISEKLGFKENMEGWYSVTAKQVRDAGAITILTNYYNTSLSSMLKTVYRDHNWQDWRFRKAPQGCWDDLENQRMALEAAAMKLGVTSKDHWYLIKSSAAAKAGIGGLLKLKYGNSLRRALAAVYPEHEWLEWRFQRSSPSWLSSPVTALRCLEWLGKQLGVQSLEGWYSVSKTDVLQHLGEFKRGKKVLVLADLVQLAYPNHDWLEWKFDSGVRNGFWNDTENQRRFVEWFANQCGIKTERDWSKITTQDFLRLGGFALVNNYYGGSVVALLKQVYPERSWIDLETT
eukprot:TRINITY_DN12180_c0_g1_i1.p1 TRINITY_DN12180_c0_g1~~TRINITY_DN12180_c0_g1_i1.p1  ORF type:complete len:350 (-),score=32.11 TRINITY_DN12180_c0_g1_i1:5-1054(-)